MVDKNIRFIDNDYHYRISKLEGVMSCPLKKIAAEFGENKTETNDKPTGCSAIHRLDAMLNYALTIPGSNFTPAALAAIRTDSLKQRKQYMQQQNNG